MNTITCKVKKAFGDHESGDQIEVSEADIDRLERKGRVRRLADARIDHARVNAIPPSPEPMKRMRFNYPGKQADGPDSALPDGPSANTAETPPPHTIPDSPATKIPEMPTELKAEVQDAGKGWYHVLVGGMPIIKDDGTPKKFREADAQAEVERINQ